MGSSFEPTNGWGLYHLKFFNQLAPVSGCGLLAGCIATASIGCVAIAATCCVANNVAFVWLALLALSFGVIPILTLWRGLTRAVVQLEETVRIQEGVQLMGEVHIQEVDGLWGSCMFRRWYKRIASSSRPFLGRVSFGFSSSPSSNGRSSSPELLIRPRCGMVLETKKMILTKFMIYL